MIPPFRSRREGVAQPVPAFVEIARRGRRAEHQIEGRPGVAPPAAGPAEHRVRPAGERVEQVVRLDRMELHRCRRREQQALRAWRNLPHELQEVVGLCRREGPLGVQVPAAGPVRLVEDDALEAHVRQPDHRLRAAGNQTGGDDPDTPRAAPNRLRAGARVLHAVFIHPPPAGPDRRRQSQQRLDQSASNSCCTHATAAAESSSQISS